MKLKQLLLCLLALLSCITAHAYDFKVNGIYYGITNANAKTVEVTNDTGDFNSQSYSGDITIPSSVSYGGATYTVTSIGDNAFEYCSGLTSVTIPNSVTSIGNYAFYSCTGLTSVTIPSSVTSIENGAFSLCSGLTSVTIGTSVTSIGSSVFYDCTGLTSISVESGNTVYDSRDNCNAIVKTSTNELFVGCKNTTIPNSVTSIGGYAFSGCTSLTSVTIPNSVTSIGGYAFNNCYGLTSVTIPNSVTSIGNSVFSGCTGLTSITIPNSVTSIGNYAFYSCTGLTSVTIPNSVTSIGNNAFYHCSGLTSITIPNSVTSIGNYAFYCTGLTSVVVENPNPVSISENVFTTQSKSTLYVPAGSKSAYQAANYWKEFKNIYTIKSIDDTFTASVPCDNGTVDLTFKTTGLYPNVVEVYDSPSGLSGELTIPATVQDAEGFSYSVLGIGAGAFSERAGLTAVTLPEGLTTIGDHSFEGTGLSAITIPESVTTIGQYAFSSSDLGAIVIPSGVTGIGASAFRDCGNLESAVLGSNVASIGSNAFYNCNELTSVTVLMTSPVAITSNVFSNRANATLYVPAGSKAAYQAANNWKNFKEIVAPIFELSELSNAKLYTLTNATGMLKLMGNTLTTTEGCLDPDHMGLVTSVSQLSSPCSDSQEGNLAALLDNDPGTFWHSNWHDGSVPAHSHYLQVELTESVDEDICLQMTRRNTPNDHITLWGVYGSNSATAPDGDWQILASISMPYGSKTETLLSDPFDTRGYKYLRFYIDGTWTNRGYAHLSEFRLFTASDIDAYRGSADKDNCKFAILNINNKYYLYSPVKQAFWLAQGAFCPGFGTVITISDNNASGDYRWRLTRPLNGTTESLCSSNTPYKIMPVEDFDPTEALAAFTENVDLGLTDGYYRIRSSDLYACGSVDGDGTLYGSWKKMADPGTDQPSLWKLTKLEGGYDLQNMHTQSHFTGAYTNNRWIMSTDGDALFAFDRVAQVNGHDVFNIRLTTQDMGDFYYMHQPWGESGPLGRWCNTGTGGGTEWVLEPVNAEEATAIASIAVGNTFAAAVPCGEGTADLTFKVTNLTPWEVDLIASPEDIAGALTIPATVQNENGIEFAVKSIGENAFKGRPLTSVELPTGLIEIGNSAFAECSYLTTINLPEGIRRFGFWAFSGSGLVSVVLPEGITDFCNAVFAGCTNLSSVEWPSDLTTISSWTFYQCSKLSSFDIPNTVSVIKDNTFRESGLESITFPSTLTTVENEAFRDCQSLQTIDFNHCPAIFEYSCFYGCSGLEELYIPNTVKFRNADGSWAWSCFGHCNSLKTVVFEAFEEGQSRWSTTTVFADCPALETVVLPSISIMQNGFFARCNNLRNVTFLEVAEDLDPRKYNFCKMFQMLDVNQIQFTVPDGCAEVLLKAGYMHISDKSALPLVRSEFEAEAARIGTMADALTDGDKTALSSSISAARSAVNAAEDYAEVYAQIAAIKAAANSFLSTATLSEGFDVTAAYVTNPDFDNLQLGWDIKQYWVTYPNVNRRGWNEASYENGDVTIDKFIDTWEGTILDDGTIEQTITNLPAGIYRLEADVIATNQNNASAEITGLSLFAGNSSTAIATENQKPQHFSMKFEHAIDGNVQIGINIIDGSNANWVAMDNVRLFYEGEAATLPQGADLVSDENARVYLYNVETGKYLSAGHSYGTHAILDETGLPLRLTQDSETGLWQIYFWEGSKSDSDQLLFSHYSSERREEVYVDYNHSRSDADEDLTLWRITQAGDGSYLIQNKKYLDTEFYLGNIPTRQDAQNEYNGVSYTDIISKASVNDNSHWLIFTKENSDQLSAKHLLMAAIMRMEASDNVNDELLAAARTVYNNADATAAEVIDITTQLNSQMGMPAENQPVDMTALIINPRFENNTTEGWSGANVVGGRADATSNHEQEFYEKDFNMYQTITGVPNGIYRLKWKGFHRPGGWDNAELLQECFQNEASAVVYAGDVQKTMKHIKDDALSEATYSNVNFNGLYIPNSMENARQYFDAGLYADSLEVEVTDNVLTIGVKNTEPMASRHWVIFSDFELYILENAEQAHNKLVASSAKGLQGGKAQLPILMDNEASIAGVQFKIRTPEGVTVSKDGAGDPKVTATNRINGMTIMSAQHEDYTQILIYGIGKNVKGNSGAIVNVALDIANTLELGDYKVDIYDIVLTEANGLRIAPFSVKSTLTLVDAEPGDANHDGEVDVADIIAVANYILGRPSAQFDETAANVNGDTSIDVADIIGIANIILHGRQALAPSVRNVADTLDPQ